MTAEVQRGVGIGIGLIAQFVLLNAWGAASLRKDEPYLIGAAVLVIILILFFGSSFSSRFDDGAAMDLPADVSDHKMQQMARYLMASHIALLAAYAFAGGGVMVLLFY